MNLPEIGIRTAKHRICTEEAMGILLTRYGASWLVAGGDLNDRDGFLEWMMNIPFKNEKGETVYISQDDAEDAYWMMSCGKMELEHSVHMFLAERRASLKLNRDEYITYLRDKGYPEEHINEKLVLYDYDDYVNKHI